MIMISEEKINIYKINKIYWKELVILKNMKKKE